MHLRNAFTLGAAVLASSLLALVPTSQASTPTGGSIAYVGVNGSTAAGSVATSGTYQSGTYSFAGSTFNCINGDVVGNVLRGPRPLAAGAHDMSFSRMTLICAHTIGVNATFSVSPGCLVTADFIDSNVHDTTVDTGAGLNFSRVDGSLTMPLNCVTFSSFGGTCTAKVSGTVPAYLDEALTTDQHLVLDGAGLTFSGQTVGCFGLMSGAFVLNNFTFNIAVTSGTTTGIDFRLTP